MAISVAAVGKPPPCGNCQFLRGDRGFCFLICKTNLDNRKKLCYNIIAWSVKRATKQKTVKYRGVAQLGDVCDPLPAADKGEQKGVAATCRLASELANDDRGLVATGRALCLERERSQCEIKRTRQGNKQGA